MNGLLAGVDIGGTKCAVCLGEAGDRDVKILGRRRFPTPGSPDETLDRITASLSELVEGYGTPSLLAIGVSCGGPLDSRAGLVLSPPNLPGWDRVDVLTPLRERFGVPAGLQNDANACALAEWKWGAGQGCRNLVFLTFGTGMGAGLILDGRLYSGTNDMAGEVGHIRLEREGPVGYGKAGSFEGFCSGGGIAQLARSFAEGRLRAGQSPLYCPTFSDLPAVTAEKVGEAALAGDETALQVWELVGRQLGRGLAILVDILNPERIILGSIYGRQRDLLEPVALRALEEEAIDRSLSECEIVPAGLGENVGDYAGLSVAMQVWQDGKKVSF